MADFASKSRLYGTTAGWKGQHYDPVGQPASSTIQLKSDEWWYAGCVSNSSIVCSNNRHSCQSNILNDGRDIQMFESVIMTNSMRKITQEIVKNYKEKPLEEQLAEERPPFLFEIARRGKGEGELRFPRSISCALTGDVVVADSGNNRIQVYNGYGIWKDSVDCNNLFVHPHMIAMSPVKEVPKVGAVIDFSHNIYLIHIEKLNLLSSIDAGYSPAAVGWTLAGHLLTVRPKIESKSIVVDVYSLSENDQVKGTMNIAIKTPFPSNRSTPFQPILQPFYGNDKCFLIGIRGNEIIACVDIKTRQVKFRCQMTSPFDGLAIDMSDFTSDPRDPNNIIVADQCNRCLLSCQLPVKAKSRLESFCKTSVICKPRDGIGAVRRCGLSPWGHAISCEYSQDLESEEEISKSRDKTTASQHRLAVFRLNYRKCQCHDWQPAKQHMMDSTINARDETEIDRKIVRRSGNYKETPVWRRQHGIFDDEKRFLDVNRPITPDTMVEDHESSRGDDDNGVSRPSTSEARTTTEKSAVSLVDEIPDTPHMVVHDEATLEPEDSNLERQTTTEVIVVEEEAIEERQPSAISEQKTVLIFDPALNKSKPNTPAITIQQETSDTLFADNSEYP